VVAIAAAHTPCAHADEGGVSFWLPGQYSSFAAVAPSPGWSLPAFFYNYGGSIGADRLLPRGHLVSSGLNSQFYGLFIAPTYTPNATILGARPSISLAFAPAYNTTSAKVAVGPLSTSRSDSLAGGSDLFPTAQLSWNSGVHNIMVYVTGAIPVGSYDPDRLSNIGIGHGAIDAGIAYTYLNTKSGTELSATLGFTKNFENPSSNYTNGIDAHLDLGAAQFLNEHFLSVLSGITISNLRPTAGSFRSSGRTSRGRAELGHRSAIISPLATRPSTPIFAATPSSVPIADFRAILSSPRSAYRYRRFFRAIRSRRKSRPSGCVPPKSVIRRGGRYKRNDDPSVMSQPRRPVSHPPRPSDATAPVRTYKDKTLS
jgi:hypothetical protein